MARNTATWSAPSVESLSHRNIRLDCDPQAVRDIWRALDMGQLKAQLAKWAGAKSQDLLDSVIDEIIAAGRTPTFPRLKGELINRLAKFHGVKYLGRHRRSGRGVRYLEAADTYAPTLVFTGRRMTISTFGDLIERKVAHIFEQP